MERAYNCQYVFWQKVGNAVIVVLALCTFRITRTTFTSFVLGDSTKSMVYFIFLMTFFSGQWYIR